MVLGGARDGYQAFSDAIANGDSTYYTITDGTDWEVGLANLSGNNLVGRSVISSSNSGSLVNFGAGTKEIFISYPASKLSPDTTDLNYTVSTGYSTSIDNFFNLPNDWKIVELVVANHNSANSVSNFYAEYGITGVDTTINFITNTVRIDSSPTTILTTSVVNQNADNMVGSGGFASLRPAGVFFLRMTRHIQSSTMYVSHEVIFPNASGEYVVSSGIRNLTISTNQQFIKIYNGGFRTIHYAIRTHT